MKSTIILVLCIAVAFVLTNCEESPTNNPVVAKKKMKTATLYLIDLDDGSKYFWSKSIFDMSGNLIAAYDSSESQQHHFYYSYDNNGKRISGTFKWIYEDHEVNGVINYEYDKNGNLIMETEVDDEGKTWSKIGYDYNSKNVLIKKIIYDNDDEIYYYEIYEYDNKGYKVKCTKYFEDEITGIYTYKYDEKGRLIEDIGPYIFNPDAIAKTVYEYNTDNEIIEIRIYNEEGILGVKFVAEYTYYD